MRRRRGRQSREPPPALVGRTLEVANLTSTDMTVMGRHANGRARLDCRVAPAASDEQLVDVGGGTGRRGQTEHRNARRALGVTPLDDPLFTHRRSLQFAQGSERLEPHGDVTGQ